MFFLFEPIHYSKSMETEEVAMSPHLSHLVYLLHFTANTILNRMVCVRGGGGEMPNCHVQNAAF